MKAKRMKFDADSVANALARIPETEKVEVDGKIKELRIKYLVGWTVVPPNMMGGGHSNFIPVDALDGASFRGAAAGEQCTVERDVPVAAPEE